MFFPLNSVQILEVEQKNPGGWGSEAYRSPKPFVIAVSLEISWLHP